MHIKDYKLDNMCATLEISKRTYYKYRNAEDKDYYDYLLIKEIFDESKKTYGYRRICDGLLIKYGVIFNHKKVLRIMKKYYLMPKYHKKLNKTIYKRIESNVMPNLLKRDFKATKPNQKWTTDITYLIYKEKRQGNLENDIHKTRGKTKEENIDYKERYEILKKYQAFLKAQREKK